MNKNILRAISHLLIYASVIACACLAYPALAFTYFDNTGRQITDETVVNNVSLPSTSCVDYTSSNSPTWITKAEQDEYEMVTSTLYIRYNQNNQYQLWGNPAIGQVTTTVNLILTAYNETSGHTYISDPIPVSEIIQNSYGFGIDPVYFTFSGGHVLASYGDTVIWTLSMDNPPFPDASGFSQFESALELEEVAAIQGDQFVSVYQDRGICPTGPELYPTIGEPMMRMEGTWTTSGFQGATGTTPAPAIIATPCATLTSTSTWGDILGASFCDTIYGALEWAIIPPTSTADYFDEQETAFSKKIPWGFWNQIKTGLLSASSTFDDTSTAIVLMIPIPGGATQTVPVIDFPTVRDRIGAKLIDQIQTLGSIMIWAMFCAWIWSLVTGKTNDLIGHDDQIDAIDEITYEDGD